MDAAQTALMMPGMTSTNRSAPAGVDGAVERLTRGVEGLYSRDDLRDKLASGSPLRIKLGMDPTAPDIHLGHCVVLRKLRQFQDLGHRAVLIIGDYTARIGDPSGRDTTRPVLDLGAIEKNAKTYLDQAGKVLDTSPDKLELRHNSEWLAGLQLADLLKLTAMTTVQQMLHRENFKKRMQSETEIQLSELMYPLMQAYDSVVVEADVELGGTDQTFNNLLGRDLMAKHGMPRQVVMVLPVLQGLDGHEKMSKSKGNTIAVNDTPDEMFGKVMSIPDGLMASYFNLLTDLPDDRITSLTAVEHTHPREAKDTLGKIVVESMHTADAATAASAEFRRRFTQHELPSDLDVVTIDKPELSIVELIRAAGFAASNSDARRLVTQGAVTLDGEKITDPQIPVTIKGGPILKVGKRRVCKVELGRS